MPKLRYRWRSDESLMLAYQAGDGGAFECLYLRHKNPLFTFLYRSCPDQAIVEEVAQETWEAVIHSAPRYVPNAAFRTWLFQIGRRRMADYWRKRDNLAHSLEDVAEPIADNTSGQNEHFEQRVLQAIGELPAEQRDTLLLKEQGFSLADIAEITGVNAETAKSRLRYGRTQLRKQLGDGL